MHKWTLYGNAATIRVFSAVTIPWSQNTYDSRGFRLCRLCNQRKSLQTTASRLQLPWDDGIDEQDKLHGGLLTRYLGKTSELVIRLTNILKLELDELKRNLNDVSARSEDFPIETRNE